MELKIFNIKLQIKITQIFVYKIYIYIFKVISIDSMLLYTFYIKNCCYYKLQTLHINWWNVIRCAQDWKPNMFCKRTLNLKVKK